MDAVTCIDAPQQETEVYFVAELVFSHIFGEGAVIGRECPYFLTFASPKLLNIIWAEVCKRINFAETLIVNKSLRHVGYL